LKESLVSPEAEVPAAYRAVQVQTKSGQSIRGIRLNEDDISIQLRDTNGNLRPFLTDTLKDIRRDKPSLMPSYGSSLSGKERDHVSHASGKRRVRARCRHRPRHVGL